MGGNTTVSRSPYQFDVPNSTSKSRSGSVLNLGQEARVLAGNPSFTPDPTQVQDALRRVQEKIVKTESERDQFIQSAAKESASSYSKGEGKEEIANADAMRRRIGHLQGYETHLKGAQTRATEKAVEEAERKVVPRTYGRMLDDALSSPVAKKAAGLARTALRSWGL